MSDMTAGFAAAYASDYDGDRDGGGAAGARIAFPGRAADIPLQRLIARIPSMDDARLRGLAARFERRRGGPWIGAFVNAHALNLCAADPRALGAFDGADLLLRDGVGMALMMRMLGQDPGLNANGTDLIPYLATRPGLRVALYGARPGVAEAAAETLRQRGANVVAARHGYHPAARYAEWLAADAPDLLILGMGAPRQEQLAQSLRDASTRPVGILCGGAILDFLAGRVRRAPAWMRRSGLEWAHRLALEPRRLARRYLIGNPVFMLRAARLAIAARRETRRDGDIRRAARETAEG